MARLRIRVKRGNTKNFALVIKNSATGAVIDLTTLNIDGARLHFKKNEDDLDADTVIELVGDIVTAPTDGKIFFSIDITTGKTGSDHEERIYYGDLLMYKDDNTLFKNLPDDEMIELEIEKRVTHKP